MTQTRRPNSSDFNPDDLTKKSDQHDKLLNALEKRVGTNENFGKTFKDAASDSKSIDEAIEKIVVKQLETNSNARTAVEGIVNGIDGRTMKQQLMGIGKIAAWAVSIVVSVCLTIWVTNLIHKAGEKPATSSNQKQN
jgi:hypothetical protein